jgi:LysR family transcriptional activator of nhaA
VELEYAQTKGRAGAELMDVMRHGVGAGRQVLRVGAVATLSRNFQLGWLRPLLSRTDVELVLRSGTLAELLPQLRDHALDVVLSNSPVPRDAASPWRVHRIGEQEASIVGRPRRGGRKFRFPDGLRNTPIVLPSTQSGLREGFDALMDQAGIRPTVFAEVDDMPMLRLMARECPAVALVPPVVVRDELERGLLVELARVPALRESFFAVTGSRRFPSPLLKVLLRPG